MSAPTPTSRLTGRGMMVVFAIGTVAAVWLLWGKPAADPLVVYCAADRSLAEPLLLEFERQTGVALRVEYQAAPDRPLTFSQRLLEERSAPRCDVLWNDQPLATRELHREGLFEPYRGPAWSRMPAVFRDPDGGWIGFAGRFRISLLNADWSDASQDAVNDAFTGDDLSRVAVADPRYGTTLAHYAVLWHEWGPSRLKAWHADVRARGLRVARGNGAVARLVASDECHLGWADTVDYFAAKSTGRPVAMLPVHVAGNRTICLPHTVSIVRGTQRIEVARRLVEFLASAQCELALARTAARLVPLGPVSEADLPEDVQPLRAWAARGYDLNELQNALGACLEWLHSDGVTAAQDAPNTRLPRSPEAPSAP